MLNEFHIHTQRFGVKKFLDPVYENEATVQFRNMNEIQTFFNNAMKNRFNSEAIQRIAKDVAPSYCCRSIKHRRLHSAQERLKILYSQIENGRARVVLINNSLKAAHKQNVLIEKNDKNLSEKFDFLDFAKRQANQLKKVFYNMVHAHFHILEKVFHYDENSTGAVPVIIDPSSVREHSTGWKSWDDPFEISALGIFKALAAYNVSKFLKLSDDIMLIALVGSQTELVSAKYLVTGKSINLKKWYGSYSVRYNIWKSKFEIPWIKFRGCSKEERFMVELKRKDRLMFYKSKIYNHQEVLIPPFIPMEQFLSDYQKRFTPPEHDVYKAIQID